MLVGMEFYGDKKIFLQQRESESIDEEASYKFNN